jgi:hypothetical protein
MGLEIAGARLNVSQFRPVEIPENDRTRHREPLSTRELPELAEQGERS